jgi:hypothetical protein
LTGIPAIATCGKGNLAKVAPPGAA